MTAALNTSPAGAPWLRWGCILLAAALLLFAMERGIAPSSQSNPRPAPGHADLALTGVAQDYGNALRQADYHLGSVNLRTQSMPGDWLMHNISARAWLARARLTGSYEDFGQADAALRRAFDTASDGTGPHVTGAVLAFSMHRLAEAERFLEATDRYAVPPDRDERAEIAAIRGDIAFYRGDYVTALKGYDDADGLVPGASDFRRAIYYGLTGEADRSEAYLNRSERALESPTRHALARLELQRGILDLERGRLEQALAHFRRADRIFPGHWLIEEHIAEVLTLQGDLAAAERLYRDIVRRTGHPEFMDALAGIAAQRGDERAGREWTDRAWAAWQVRIAQFPEAAYGHAIDHCVGKRDWASALSLAQRNHEARPYGDAKVKLAQALLGNGRAAEARLMIEAVLRSPWRSADLHGTAADIYAALGLASQAAAQRRLARAINPVI